MRKSPNFDSWQGLRDRLQSIKQHRQILENTFVEAVS
jgi:hypothetical protein